MLTNPRAATSGVATKRTGPGAYYYYLPGLRLASANAASVITGAVLTWAKRSR